MAGDLPSLLEVWLGGLRLAPNTIRTYRGNILDFTAWLEGQNLDLAGVSLDDLQRYSLHVHQQGLRPATMGGRFIAIRAFYRWMYADGRIAVDPAASFSPRYTSKQVGAEVLSLRDLKVLVKAASDPRDRAAILLMIVVGIGGKDIVQAKVSDLVERADGHALRLARGDLIPLPALVATPLLEVVGGRRRGLLLMNKRGRPLDRPALGRMTIRCGRAAKLGVSVTPQLLLASMRHLAVNEPIPMTTLLQGLGFGAYSNLAERAKVSPTATQHLAVRMALLLRPGDDAAEVLLDHADSLSAHHGLPSSARVAVAGAAFERHLRALAISTGALPGNVERTQLGSLAGHLVRTGTMTEADNQSCAWIARARDWAAHGWYEKVTAEVADRAVREMRRLVEAYPLVQPEP